MTNQPNKNRQAPGEDDGTTAGGGDETEAEGRRAKENADRQPGGGRHSESEKPNSPDSRWGSDSKDER